eukprot:5214613-Amphidinium_carterae.1
MEIANIQNMFKIPSKMLNYDVVYYSVALHAGRLWFKYKENSASMLSQDDKDFNIKNDKEQSKNNSFSAITRSTQHYL